jgi:SOS response regulatory protein OraA/RecX/cell division protein FtsB
MKINNSVQNIKSPILKGTEKRNEKEEVKDSAVITLQKETNENQIDNLKKMKEAIEKGVNALQEGAEITSEYLDNSPKADGTLTGALQFFKTIRAFPRFIYPSLIGMNSQEREAVMSVLDGLPLKDVGAVKSITMANSLPGGSGGAGPVPFSPFVLLSRDSVGSNVEWLKEVATHEIGHAKDYETGLFGLPKLFSESSKSPWGKPPYITSYAETGPGWYPAEWDDFAESFAYYHRNPQELKAKCPEKFARMEELEKSGSFQGLIDNDAFRETGKLMGSIMEKVPYLQNGLAMISFIGGIAQAFKGLGEMRRGEKTGDEKLKMNATMNFAAGACFASKLFCIPGMAIEGAKSELNRSIDKKEITAEQANAVVQATVGVIAGPVGKAINWVIAKLPWNKLYEINDSTIENLTGQIAEYKLDFINALKDKELTKKELKKILTKMEFTSDEIDIVKEYADKPEGIKVDPAAYKITDSTIENIKDKLPENKMDILNSISDRELTEKELNKILDKLNFDRGEIALIKAFAEAIEKDVTEGQNSNTGSVKRAASVGIGGAAGAVAGGFVGPYLGVLAGFAIGGPIGGVVGLIAGALAGFKTGSYLGGRAGNLVGKGLEKLIEGEVNGNNDKDKPL